MLLSKLFHKNTQRETNLRNFIFGVEDSLVSTVGLLSGIASANVSRSSIITTGLVLIVVEGLSMGIGSFLTQETTDEIAGSKDDYKKSVLGGIIMLVSYCLSGLIPLFPYTFLAGSAAVTLSVTSSLIGLFILGFGTSLYFKSPTPHLRGLRMSLMGGIAVAVGMLIGNIFHV